MFVLVKKSKYDFYKKMFYELDSECTILRAYKNSQEKKDGMFRSMIYDKEKEIERLNEQIKIYKQKYADEVQKRLKLIEILDANGFSGCKKLQFKVDDVVKNSKWNGDCDG